MVTAAGHSGAFSGSDGSRTSQLQGRIHPIPSQEVRNSQHHGWPLGWEQMGLWKPQAFPPTGVFVKGPARRHLRGVMSTPMRRKFGRGGRYYGRSYKNQGAIQDKPHYGASAEVTKELKSRYEKFKSSAVSSDGSLAEKRAVAEEKPPSQMNKSAGDTRAPSHSESALNNDCKMCNTNPHLNH